MLISQNQSCGVLTLIVLTLSFIEINFCMSAGSVRKFRFSERKRRLVCSVTNALRKEAFLIVANKVKPENCSKQSED